MTKKIIVAIIALAFILSVLIPALANDDSAKKAGQTAQLVALLPASDGIMTVDTKRLLNEALPQILSGKQADLTKINGKIDEFKSKTGIDLRRFEQIAVGVKAKQVSPAKFEFEPVILARGSYNADALVSVAKIASKGKYREEKIGNRTVYIFSVKEIIEENKPKTDDFLQKIMDKMLNSTNGEFALTSFDGRTLAFGSTARVKEMFEGKSRVNNDLLDLVYRDQTAVMSFGANMPKGMSRFFELDNEEIDKNIDVIKQIYGTLNVNSTNANVLLTAKTSNNQDATELENFLNAMTEVGKALLGFSKSNGKTEVYTRMIENAKISRQTNEVSLDVKVAQSDLDVILGAKK